MVANKFFLKIIKWEKQVVAFFFLLLRLIRMQMKYFTLCLVALFPSAASATSFLIIKTKSVFTGIQSLFAGNQFCNIWWPLLVSVIIKPRLLYFFTVMPILIGGFGNFFVSILIGTPDMMRELCCIEFMTTSRLGIIYIIYFKKFFVKFAERAAKEKTGVNEINNAN